jgi:RNA polymerase sigma-70 factor (ECF subfamily)
MAYNVAFRITKNKEDAEEIAQDAFVKAFKSLKSFKGKSKFSTWIYRIIYNSAISHIRKNQIETSTINEEIINETILNETYSGINKLNLDEQKKYINIAIESLNEDEAVIITLYYLNETSIDDISNITNYTKSNVKVKLFRARKKLYVELQKLLKEELIEIL